MKLGYRLDSTGEIADAKVYIFRESATHSPYPSPPACAARALPSDPCHLSSGHLTSAPVAYCLAKEQKGNINHEKQRVKDKIPLSAPLRSRVSGRVLDADHQPLAERREGGMELLGLAGVAQGEQPLDGGRADTHPAGELGLGEAGGAERQVKSGLGGDQPARGDSRPPPRRRRFGDRRAPADPPRQRLFQAVDGAGKGVPRVGESEVVSRRSPPFRQLYP